MLLFPFFICLVEEGGGKVLGQGFCFRVQHFVLNGARDSPTRTAAHNKHEEYYDVMKPVLVASLLYVWETCSVGGISAESFLASHSNALSMFHDVEELEKVVSMDDEQKLKISGLIRKIVSQGPVTESMFRSDWVQASREYFRSEIGKQVKIVEDLRFEQKEIGAFVHVCKKLTQDLMAIGHRNFEKVWTTVFYMGQNCGLYLETPQDEWEFRLAAAQRSASVNSSQTAMMPWERLVLRPGEIPKTPQTSSVPDAQLRLFIIARKQALEFLPTGCVSLDKMIHTILSKSKEIKKVDRTFALDIAFLEEHAVRLLQSQIREGILACLPSTEVVISMDETIKKLSALERTEQYFSATATMQGEVSSAKSLVQTLSRRYSPNLKNVDDYSDFYKLVLKRVELFYKAVIPCKQPAAGGLKKYGKVNKDVRGAEALQHRFEEVQALITHTKHKLVVEDLMELRQFSWVLSTEQFDTLRSWIGMLAPGGASMQALEDAGDEEGGGKKGELVLASNVQVGGSSGSTCPFPPVKGTKSEKAGAKADAACDDMLTKFFVKRKGLVSAKKTTS